MALAKKRSSRRLIEHEINLTSLMDVLTVLIFFLVQAFTITSKPIQVPKDIRLPTSGVQSVPRELVTLSISSGEIFGNGAKLVSYNGSRFPESAFGSKEDSRTLVRVEEFLKAELAKSNQSYQAAAVERDPPGKLMIAADRELPFSVLKHIFYTATVSGYADYQFLVRKSGKAP